MKGNRIMKKTTNVKQQKLSQFMHEFTHVNRLHRTMVEAEISKLGIHCSQYQMLVLIAQSKNICQKEIAQKLEISSAAVAVTLNKLELSGLVERTQSFDDARMNHITVTDKGAELLNSTKSLLDDVDNRFFDGIDEEDIDTALDVLTAMTENVKSSRE